MPAPNVLYMNLIPDEELLIIDIDLDIKAISRN